MFKFLDRFKKRKVFNELTGVMTVEVINGEDYCFVKQKNQHFKIEAYEDTFKIYGFFLNLAGELEVEYLK